MAEETVDTTAETAATPPQRQLASARQFLAEHGKPAKAVLEHLGRAGVRVVLIGADGALGDVVVETTAVAEALVAAVDELEQASWDAETVNATVIGSAHRRRMAGSVTRR